MCGQPVFQPFPKKEGLLALGGSSIKLKIFGNTVLQVKGTRTILFDEKVESKLDYRVVEFKHQ